RAEQPRASVVPRGAGDACRAARARRARGVSVATRRGRDRKGRVLDESRRVATSQRHPPALTTVVTLHGLWMRPGAMMILQRRLRAAGFDVHGFGYATVRRSLEANAAALAEFIGR